MADLDNDTTGKGFDPEALAAKWKLDEKQLAFCLEILGGSNQSQAARAAGYTHDGIKLRKKASELAGTQKIKGFLADARKFGAELDDEPIMDEDARLRLLSRYAKSNDRTTALRAVELLDKMQTRKAAEADELPDPRTILKQIAAMSPLLGAILSHYGLAGLDMPDVDADAVRRWHCPACAAQIIENLKTARASPVAVLKNDPAFLTNGHAGVGSGVEIAE